MGKKKYLNPCCVCIDVFNLFINVYFKIKNSTTKRRPSCGTMLVAAAVAAPPSCWGKGRGGRGGGGAMRKCLKRKLKKSECRAPSRTFAIPFFAIPIVMSFLDTVSVHRDLILVNKLWHRAAERLTQVSVQPVNRGKCIDLISHSLTR